MVGQRSRSNARKSCFDIPFMLIQGQGQRLESRSKVGSRSCVKVKGQISGVQRSILGDRLCRVQQRAKIVITSLRVLSVCL